MKPSRYITWININRACNLRCKWCYAQSKKYSKTDSISTKTVSNIMSIVGSLPHRVLILIGGEPTIHTDFLSIIKEISKYENIFLGVVTNGIMLKDKSFLKSSISNGLDGITLSLKAPNSKLYEKYTGKPNAIYDISKGIDNLNSINQKFTLSITMNDELLNYLDDFIMFIKNHNVKKVYLDSERPIIMNNQATFENDTIYEDKNFYRKIYDAFKNSSIKYTLKVSVPFCTIEKSLLEEMMAEKVVQSGCHIFKSSGLIFDTKGYLLLCNSLCENPIGKIGVDFNSTQELLDFRGSRPVNNLYKKLQSYPDKKCTKCKHWQFCGGGCRIHWLYRNMVKGGDKYDSSGVIQ